MSRRTDKPSELLILNAITARLATGKGDRFYHDCDGAYLIDRPQIKFLGEVGDSADGKEKSLALVSPGDMNIAPDSTCASRFTGDCIVTVACRFGGPELPWLPGYRDPAALKLEMCDDVFRLLEGYAVPGTNAILHLSNRNLDIIEVDGWAIAQLQVAVEFSEVDP